LAVFLPFVFGQTGIYADSYPNTSGIMSVQHIHNTHTHTHPW